MGLRGNIDGSFGVADGSNITAVDRITGEEFEIDMQPLFPTITLTPASISISIEDYKIHKIEVLVPNKVVRVSFGCERENRGLWADFYDDTKVTYTNQQKSICNEKEDEFSLRKGVLVCLAKHLYGDIIVADKIEIIAEQLDWYKEHNKKVTKAIRTYEKELKAEELKVRREAEEKKRIADKKKKNAEKIRNAKGDKTKDIVDAIQLGIQEAMRNVKNELESSTHTVGLGITKGRK